MRIIIEGVKANHIHLPTFITFIEFKKAFDSLHRVKMMRIPKAYSTKPNLRFTPSYVAIYIEAMLIFSIIIYYI